MKSLRETRVFILTAMVLLTLSVSPVTAPFCVFCTGDISRHGASLAHKAADSFRMVHHDVLGAIRAEDGLDRVSFVPVGAAPLSAQRPGAPIRHPVLRI